MKVKSAMKWTLLGGALAFVILYGIEMSSSGIERIYGPIEAEDGYTEIVQPEPSAQPVNEIDPTRQKIEQLEKELAEIKRQAGLASDSDWSGEEEELPLENERLPGIPLENDQPAVNRLADSTSGLLENMSSEGIRIVVSIFDGLTK